MGRRKRVVEGFVLNLDDFVSSDATIETLLAEIEKKTTPEVKKREVKAKSYEEIFDRLRSTYTCTTCYRQCYALKAKRWKGKLVCYACHHYERSNISAELETYVKDVYSRGCTFCDMRRGRFHLDHINMFSKVESVGVMMEIGSSAEAIKEEIAKCQLLCVDCHMFVTRYEAKCGFIKEKKQLNRAIAAGKDVTGLRQELYDKYEIVMTKMYPRIRERLRVGSSKDASGGGIDDEIIRHETDESDESSCGDDDDDF